MTKAKGGSNAGANRITLCTSCNDKHERYGRAVQHRSTEEAAAGRVQEGFAAAGWRRVRAAVARSYGVSKSAVSRFVQSARLSGGLVVAGLATPALSNP